MNEVKLMLSKNNSKKRLNETEPRQERYSIRKFSVGAASVLIGLSLLGMSPTQTVRADSTTKAETSTDSRTSSLNVAKSNNGQPPTKERPMASNTDQQVAVKAQENVETVKFEDSVKVKKEEPKTEEIKPLIKDDSQVAQESTPVKRAKKTTSNETTVAAQKELPTIDSFVKEYKTLEEQAKSGKLNETDMQKAAERLQEKMANLSPADQLKLATLITPVATPRSEDVSDWSSLVRKVEDEGVGTINITNDITVDGSSDLTSIGTNGLLLNRSGIARDLTINGNGHNIDFGQYYVKLGNDTQTSDHPNWNITFRDINSRAHALPASGQYAPLYLGQIGSGTGNDAAVSADNQKNITITFDGVTAIADGRYGVISGHQDGDGPVDVSGEYYHLILTGNTNIQNDGVTTGSRPGDDGDAVSAGYVTIEGTGQVSVSQNHTSSYNLQQGGAVIRVAQPDLVSGGTVTQYSLDVKQDAILHINGARDIKGIVIANGKTGTANIDGETTINLLDFSSPNSGHSIAILAGNLNVGQKGWLVIKSSQVQTGDRTLDNFDSGKYGILSIGIGFPGDTTNAAANTINVNGDIEITRTVRDRTMSPMISMGSDAMGGNFTINVNQGATLRLRDTIEQNDLGMISVSGADSVVTFNFNSPKEVNLQRLNDLPTNGSDLIYLESRQNRVNINRSPVAQWDAANKTEHPDHTWIIDTASSMNNYGINAGTGFTAAGQSAAENSNGQADFLHSNGSVTMNLVQSGKDQYSYDGSRIAPGTSGQGVVEAGTPTHGANYYTPYLSDFLKHFNYWTPQRLVIGSLIFSSPIINDDNLRNQPRAQALNATTSQTLSDLDPNAAIAELIRAMDSTGHPIYSLLRGMINYYINDKVSWYDPATDAAEWARLMSGFPAPNNPTGNLHSTDTHAWAKVTYRDGSVDFIDIPLNIMATTHTLHPDDSTIDPTNPGENSDMYKHPTRTIHVINPDGSTHDTIQTIWFGRTKTVSTDPAVGTTYGNWQTGRFDENNNFIIDPLVSKQWDAFTAPTISGYDASPASVSAQTVNTATLDTVVTITYNRHNVTPPTPTEGEVVITYVDKNNPSHSLGSISVYGVRGSLVVVRLAIENNVPAGWRLDPTYVVPTTVLVPGSITVPLVPADDNPNPGDDDHDHETPVNPGDHGRGKPVNPSDNGNNGHGNKENNNNQSLTHDDNHHRAKNNYGHKVVTVKNHMTTISGRKASSNSVTKRVLPQTGNSVALGIVGLTIASLGILLGLGINKKRKN
jgi:hypothetical protein